MALTGSAPARPVDDRLSASASARNFGESATNDLLGGQAGDVLAAPVTRVSAVNHLSGGEGNHRLTATAVFSSATSILDGGAADNVLFAADATEFGDGGRHELFGDEGDDELTAVAGGHSFGTPNLLDGSAGSDVLRGGSGRDTLIIDAEDLIGAGASVSGGPGAFDRPDPFGDRLVVDLTLISLPSAIRGSPILKVWT